MRGGAAGLGLGELDSRFDLRQHGAGGELAFGHVLAGLLRGQFVQILLVGLAEVDGDLLDSRQDDEHIGVKLLGHALGGEVLVA